MAEERNFFEVGVNTDVSKWIEQKNKLDYLEWSAAWTLLKKKYPLSTYTPDKTLDGRPWFVDDVSKSGWVSGTLKIPELDYELSDTYAIMDFKMQAEALEKINAVSANKAQRRLMTKLISEAVGIGLSLYSKSDSTSDDKEIELAREKLSEIYKKRAKLSEKAKTEADAIVKDTNEKIELALDDQDRLGIYAEAKNRMMEVRK